MNTLDGTEWDVVISGTGFSQSLLALSLSRSSKRILHLDREDYYGGDEAAFSLAEAEEWAGKHSSDSTASRFSHASVTKPNTENTTNDRPRLASSRAYSLTLSPQLIYSRSNLIDTVVSSQIHNQLDFQAVGSFFILNPRPASFSLTRLARVPSAREDVFSDTTLDLRAKRGLMKFLRFVSNYEEQMEVWEAEKETPFPAFLERKFGLPMAAHGPILALTMSEQPPVATSTASALPRIARYIRSIGVFGPGFGAVLPKWGGLAEIVQVACRACAVGGGVYVLNKGIETVSKEADGHHGAGMGLKLDGGERVTTTWLVGSRSDIPAAVPESNSTETFGTATSRSIAIVASPLSALFPRTSEGGPIPAGAVIVVPSPNTAEPPVHILAHTSEAGECPRDQCVLYSSVSLPAESGFNRIDEAVKSLLDSVISPTPSSSSEDEESERVVPQVLWKMQYQLQTPTSSHTQVINNDGIIVMPSMSHALIFDDGMLDDVRSIWQIINENDGDEEFMRFAAREGEADSWGDDG